MSLRLGSLCSGYGGLDLALAQVLDVDPVWHAENDPHAARVLAHHWPDVPNLGDLTAVDWSTVEPVDVVTAGFPCQPISQAGRRKVTNDARWLWPRIAHAVRVLRPRLVVLENVPPLLRPWRDDDGWWNPAPIEEVTADLAGLVYVGHGRRLAAADVGAPHLRERVFVVAGDASGAGWEGRGPAGPQWGSRAAHPGLDVAADASDLGRQWDWLARRGFSGPSLDCGVAADAGGPGWPTRQGSGRCPVQGAEVDERATEQPGRLHRCGSCASPVASADTDGQRLEGGSELHERSVGPGLAAPRRNDADGLGEIAGVIDWGTYGPAIARWEDVLARPAPAPTDAAGRLNPPFVEWMLGLPAGWVTDVPGVPRTAQLRILGNGVCPQQGAAALGSLLAHLQAEPAA